MAERAEEERRDPAADAVAVAVYSVLVLLLRRTFRHEGWRREGIRFGHGAGDAAKSKTAPIVTSIA